ncbi:MAG: hypothetical protein ACOCZ5_01065 [bacterium]
MSKKDYIEEKVKREKEHFVNNYLIRRKKELEEYDYCKGKYIRKSEFIETLEKEYEELLNRDIDDIYYNGVKDTVSRYILEPYYKRTY